MFFVRKQTITNDGIITSETETFTNDGLATA